MITEDILEPFLGKRIRVKRSDLAPYFVGELICALREQLQLRVRHGASEVIPYDKIVSVEYEDAGGIVMALFPPPEKTFTAKEIMNELFPETPPHYAGEVTPWDLQKCMKSSGNAFVDARRTDAIEYCFRMKGDLLDDLKKARHCIEEAIKFLEVK